MKYKIVNHRTEEDTPAWHWYLYDDFGVERCQSARRFGTRTGALDDCFNFLRIVIHTESGVTNWYTLWENDPGLKDEHYLEEERERKWLEGEGV